jgi:hypothetical protein
MQHRDYVKAAKDLVLKSGCTKIKTVAVKGDALKESIKTMVKSLNGFDWKTLEESTLDVFAELGCVVVEGAPDSEWNKSKTEKVTPISKGKKSTQQGPALIDAAQDVIDFLGFPKNTIADFKKLGTAKMVEELQKMANEINMPYKEGDKEIQPDDSQSDFKPETITVFEDNGITVNWNDLQARDNEQVKESETKAEAKKKAPAKAKTEKKEELALHDYANLFPEMGDDDFNAIVKDMQENGFRADRPIILFDGKIADGKNRYKASLAAKVKPTFTEFEGTKNELFKHVIALNLTRRHLTPAQRATLAAELLPEFEKEAKKQQKAGGSGKKAETPIRATEEAAKATGSTKEAVSTAKQIKKKDPKVFDEMKKGKKTIAQGKRETETKSNEELFHSAEKMLKAKLKMTTKAIHDFIDSAELAEQENQYSDDLELIENSILKILG